MRELEKPEVREEAVADAGIKLYAVAVQEASELSASSGISMGDALRMARVALAIQLKRNLIVGAFKPTKYLDRVNFKGLVQDY